MSSPSLIARVSPELRAAIYHFSVFGTNGVISVYFGVWLSLRGIHPGEIGIINAAPVLLMLMINQFVSRVADRASDWRGVIIVLSLIAGTIPIGLFFVSGFWGILLIWALSITPALALVPLTDAATLRMTQRRGTNFSAVRAWGTVGFMIAGVSAGPLIGVFGDGSFLPIFVGMALCRALVSFQLPKFKAEPAADAVAHKQGATALRQVLKPWFVMTLIGLGILYSTHGAFGAFAALEWHKQGLPEALVGPLVGTMAASEAVMMFVWRRLNLKMSARHIIIFACFVAAIRWTAMAFAPPLPVMFGLQLLHAITFAMGYLGGIYFIANWTSEHIAAEAQGFSFVVQQSMSVVALLGMGWAYGAIGHWAWVVLGAYVLVGALFVWVSMRVKPPGDPHQTLQAAAAVAVQ
jgi:MFS transporter, PPP family, 3-phenylpropionic acid transporter